MATEAIRTCVATFDETLLTCLNDENFQIEHLKPVFYLHDDIDPDPPAAENIPPDAEYGDMIQPERTDADDIEFES